MKITLLRVYWLFLVKVMYPAFHRHEEWTYTKLMMCYDRELARYEK